MLEQTEHLAARGILIRRFSWYPLFDCAGWNSLLQGTRWTRDPQGIYRCDRSWRRERTELSALYRELPQGLTSVEIPAYAFGAVHDQTLGALKQQMRWDWIPQDAQLPAAHHDVLPADRRLVPARLRTTGPK